MRCQVGTHAPNGGESIWIVIIGPLVGGLFAGLTFRLTHPDEMEGCRLFRLGPKEFSDERRQAAPYVIEFIGTFLLAYTT